METALRRLRRGAELLCAAIFAVMFGAFCLQIFTRYVLGDPIAWTHEICAIAYVWVVCLASAAILGEREHVTFDLLYKTATPRWRRRLALLGTGFIGATFLAALPGTLDYVAFMGSQRSMTLRLPLDLVFGAFGVFMVLAVLGAARRFRRLATTGWEREP